MEGRQTDTRFKGQLDLDRVEGRQTDTRFKGQLDLDR